MTRFKRKMYFKFLNKRYVNSKKAHKLARYYTEECCRPLEVLKARELELRLELNENVIV